MTDSLGAHKVPSNAQEEDHFLGVMKRVVTYLQQHWLEDIVVMRESAGADPGEGLWGLKPPPSKLMIFISRLLIWQDRWIRTNLASLLPL